MRLRRGGTRVLLVTAALGFAAAVPLDILPLLRGPAPYPPEWQWELRALWAGGQAMPARLLLAIGAALALFALLAASGSARARRRPRAASALLLAGAVVAGWVFQLGLAGLDPAGALRTVTARTTSRTITSYHAAALLPEARDPLAFLQRHHELVPGLRTSAKHAATHPPGPVLFFRGLVAVCEAWPRPTRWTLAALDDTPDRPFSPPSSPASRAAALLGGLLLGFLGAAAAWPVAALAERATGDPLAAARVGVLWCLVPGPVLMAPQVDQALALLVAGATALLARAATAARPAVPALLAGLCAGLAGFVSYGAAAFLLIGGVAALALAPEGGLSRRVKAAAGAVAGALAVVGATALLGHHPLRSALAALAVHREVYTAPRSYALWLAFNPLDFAVFLGLPVAILFAVRVRRAVLDGCPRPADRFAAAVAAGLLLLVLSGATRGEVGRIWVPLMPFVLVAALAGPVGGGEPEAGPRPADALLLAALLVPVSVAIRLYWAL
jgi:hypothetical protein